MSEKEKSIKLQRELVSCFHHPLPGVSAHLAMAPLHRRSEIQDPLRQARAVKSSVLILLYEKAGEPHIVFIRRPEYNGVHSGQIAFPGGRWEATDKSLYHTALRETREEIGIDTQNIQYAGKLTDLYIPPSNYIVSPFAGFLSGEFSFKPDPQEVAEIIEIPLSFILQENPIQPVSLTVRGEVFKEIPAYVYGENIIWGATAMMLNEFVVQWKTTVK